MNHHGMQIRLTSLLILKRKQCLFSMIYFQEDVHKDELCTLFPVNTTAAGLCKLLNDYVSEKLNGSLFVNIYTYGEVTMT